MPSLWMCFPWKKWGYFFPDPSINLGLAWWMLGIASPLAPFRSQGHEHMSISTNKIMETSNEGVQ